MTAASNSICESTTAGRDEVKNWSIFLFLDFPRLPTYGRSVVPAVDYRSLSGER